VVETAAGGGRTVVRPWLAARTQTVTAEIARSLGLDRPAGALVADVWPGGAAARAGLRTGDVIISVNGQPAADAAAVAYAVSSSRPGDTLRLGVLREGQREQTLTLRAEAPPSTPRDERVIAGRNPIDGATVVNLSPATAIELGVDPFVGEGVLVTRIGRGFALNANLRPGDIIRRVNGRQINTVRDLAAVTSTPTPVWSVTIERNGQEQTGNFRL
jgi:S1-C subfamily serine protease